jgi:hypothetical protein
MSIEFDSYILASRQLNDRVASGQLPFAQQGAGFAVSPVRHQAVPPLVSIVASTGQLIQAADIAGWYGPLFTELGALGPLGVKTSLRARMASEVEPGA